MSTAPDTATAPADVPRGLAAVADRSSWGRRHGRLHPASVEALAASGLFSPDRAPGGDGPSARTLLDEVAEVARLDGAAGWVLAEHRLASWIVGHFPEPVRAVVRSGAGAPLCGTLGPTGVLVPADGGATAVLHGRWTAVSGAGRARWQVVVAVRRPVEPAPGERPAEPVAVLVETAALTRTDLPAPAALRGAGRGTVVADGVVVPAERVLPLHRLLAGDRLGVDALHRAPLVPVAALTTVAFLLGPARAAQERYRALDPRDGSGAGGRAGRRAELLEDAARALAGELDGPATGGPWPPARRRAVREDLGRAVRLAGEVVGGLAAAVPHDGPLADLACDVGAVDEHGLSRPDGARELYARALCGLYL